MDRAKCCYVLKRGKNAGSSCPAYASTPEGFCKKHHTPYFSLDVLPTSIIDEIIQRVFDKEEFGENDAKLALVLEATCKTFQRAIESADVFSKIKRDLAPFPTPSQFSTKKVLELYGQRGCQFCNKPRIRKVYTEYGVRCCEQCLHERTISGYKLETDYYLQDQKIFQGARKREVESYNPYARWRSKYFTVTFYWKQDIEDILQAVHGCSLNDIRQRIIDEMIAHNRGLLDKYVAKDGRVTVEYVMDHTGYLKVHHQVKINVPTIKGFIKDAFTTLRKNYIIQKFTSFGWTNEQLPKKEFDRSNIYRSLLTTRQVVLIEDYNSIMGEIENMNYDKSYMNFLKSFKQDASAVENVDFVKEKYASRQMFTAEDKIKVNTYFEEQVLRSINEVEQKRIQKTSFDGVYYYCECSGMRQFSADGVFAHTRDKHRIVLTDTEMMAVKLRPRC